MVRVKPFKALRPPKDLVARVSCPPYDGMNSQEAAALAAGDEGSLHNNTRAENNSP
ncbi:MAG: DUF1015 family protein, partial [Bacteroidales bacterium]|nr:DUF1015 family protein [Bacteroidales bacterium]